MGSGNFSLTKWYLDVITDDGSVAIAYWADVHWKSLQHAFCGIVFRPAESASASSRFSSRRVAPPRLHPLGLQWESKPLRLSAEFVRHESAFEHRLFEGTDGVIDWRCEVPRAEVRLCIGDTRLEGTGYAERLDLTLLPWHIPANEIRWGRFLAAGTSIVWIDWRGDHPLRLCFHNGCLVAVTAVSEEGIRFENGQQLVLCNSRVINADRLGGLLAPLEMLRPIVEPIAYVHQTRWLSDGTLTGKTAETRCGRALHELVKRR